MSNLMASDVLVSVNLLDADGDTRAAKVHLPAATTEADIQTFATAYMPLLDAVVDGKITAASYSKPLTLPGGLKAGAVANSEVQKGANFSFVNASRYKYGVWIPAWQPGLFTGDLVNQAGAGVANFINGYIAGLGGVLPTNGFGFDLTALAHATKTFRK